jgi:hypothetical protein
LPSRSTRFGLFEQARLIYINRLLQRFSLVCRRGCATIRRCLAGWKIAAPHNQKISTHFKLGRLFGRLSTKAFDVGDETEDDEIGDAVIGERRAL